MCRAMMIAFRELDGLFEVKNSTQRVNDNQNHNASAHGSKIHCFWLKDETRVKDKG